MKYGGSKTLDDGPKHAALFSLKLTSNPGNPGNQPGDSGTSTMAWFRADCYGHQQCLKSEYKVYNYSM